ncbi:site-specific integrase [Belnapia mucosa]|nr:hypothetical protein [Belnapia mucosa]
MSIGDLCDRYLADMETGRLLTRHRQIKKPSTLRIDRSRVEVHIRPLLGAVPVAALTREDAERAMSLIAEGRISQQVRRDKYGLSNVRGGRGAASRTIGLLGAILTYAVRLGLRADNPVHGVVRPADGRRERRLRVEEYVALGEGLLVAEDDTEVWAPGLVAIRFLLLTGWRRGEVLGLRWPDIDLARRTAPADLGLADATIGTLLGHRDHTITQRYIHSADAALLAAADAVAERTAELMAGIVRPPHPTQVLASSIA